MVTTIRLDSETEQRLDLLVSKSGRSKALYLGEIIKRGFEDVEDLYTVEQRLLETPDGRSITYTPDKMIRDLELTVISS